VVESRTVAAAPTASTTRVCSEPPWGPVRVELLQSFRLARANTLIPLPLSVQRVVAFVALAGRPLQRLYVAGNLWLNSSEEHANASLRTALWRLRRTGIRVIVPLESQLTLHDEVEVDVHKVEEQAELAIAGEGADSELSLLCSPGELLSDWYDDWVIIERERVRERQLHGLEALCASLTAKNQFTNAVAAGLAAVACEPLRESAHRVLIKAYLAEGNACDALREYRLYEDLLRRRLGLSPSPLLDQLIEPVRAGAPLERFRA
jgi:DNA-binding SARP family transcriptional activator